jgi:hypothetical protein
MASTRIASIAAAALVVVLSSPTRQARCERIATEEIVGAGQLSDIVAVRSVRTSPDGEVTGELVNRSTGRLRNVRLMITHAWLWTNEMHPGTEGPGHTVYLTVPDEIPPGGRVSFTYHPAEPLTSRSDGRFETTVEVVGLEKFPV